MTTCPIGRSGRPLGTDSVLDSVINGAPWAVPVGRIPRCNRNYVVHISTSLIGIYFRLPNTLFAWIISQLARLAL